MKKNATNTFSQGLNFDLTPLTTPNNILTDCVNGTFSTFNGDELSLQNDAGNSKIPYNTTETTTTSTVVITNPDQPDQIIEVPIESFWGLSQSETIDENLVWNKIQYNSGTTTTLVNNIVPGYNFLYISVPKDSSLAIYNALNILLYNNLLDDSGQLFSYIGEYQTPGGATNDVYRKNDVYNTGQQVLFYLTITHPENIENIIVIPGEGGTTEVITTTTTEYVSDYVKLSDGFYPLGIKEYGGVLYIISKNTPNIEVSEWENGTAYKYGDFVYSNFTEKIYYKSIDLLGNNVYPLPISTNNYWEVIGNYKEFINYISTVEIGSYPSPEFGGNTEHPGSSIVLVNESDNGNTIENFLYKPIIINEEFFKSGRYAIFYGDSVDTSNISSFKWIPETESFTYLQKFYKVKLYHQLNNGYLDITDDIWSKYFEFKGTNIDNNFWFLDQDFMYYCPSQYKGKLAISLEIEGLVEFKVLSADIITNSDYSFILKVSGIGGSYIDVTDSKFEVWIDNEKIFFGADDFKIVQIVDNKCEFLLEHLDESYKNSVIKYRITPIISIDGISKFGIEELPKEYLDKFTLVGSRLIASSYDEIVFEPTNSNYECNSDGSKTYLEYTLKNSNSVYLSNLLEPSEFPYVFLHEDRSGVPITSGAQVIGSYYIVDKKPIMNTPTYLEIDTYVLTLFSQKEVEEYSEQSLIDCGIETPFIPELVSVNELGWVTIFNTNGEYIFSATLGQSSATYSYKTCSAYDKDTKLLFVGGNAGLLHIYDLSSPNVGIVSKSIKVFNETDSISSVTLLEDAISKKIMIGRANGCYGYMQPFYNNINSYVNLETIQCGTFWNGTGHIRSFLYNDGIYFASTKNGEIFKTSDITQTWTEIDDLNDDYLKMVQTESYIWIPEVEDDLIYIDKNNVNQLIRWGLSGSKRQQVRELIPINNDSLIAICDDPTESIWKVASPNSSLNITPITINTCTSGAYDGSKYVYLSVQDFAGVNKIAKYNLNVGLGESLWEYFNNPVKATKLFIY